MGRTLTTAAGPLRKRLEEQGYSPQGLHEQLETFRNHRNELAHEFFLDFARVLKAGDPEAHDAALKFLEAMRLFFEEQTDMLDALSDEEVGKRDWDLDDSHGGGQGFESPRVHSFFLGFAGEMQHAKEAQS